jgi:glycosyltransferase involved in cell wall biosynthesis
MRIIFLCGSLEPGRDGVGDYSRRLARELVKQGHQVSLAAINDMHLLKDSKHSQQDMDEDFQTLRLSSFTSWQKRMDTLRIFIHQLSPDWISLQYVPFSFQNKGLPIFLAGKLKKVSIGVKWHIMFHELWVGNAVLKLRILGAIQKLLIENMLRTIKPDVVHTHLPIYYKDLVGLSVKVKELPLFSNFSENITTVEEEPNIFRVAFFNQVTQNPRVFDFLVDLCHLSDERKLHFEILLIGSSTGPLAAFSERIASIHCLQNKIKCVGFVEEELVPQVLKSCNIGVSPMSFSELGKSGTTAAFLAQGIPIAVPISDEKGIPFFNPELLDVLVTEPDWDKIKRAGAAAKQLKDHLSVSRIAKKLLVDLNCLT